MDFDTIRTRVCTGWWQDKLLLSLKPYMSLWTSCRNTWCFLKTHVVSMGASGGVASQPNESHRVSCRVSRLHWKLQHSQKGDVSGCRLRIPAYSPVATPREATFIAGQSYGPSRPRRRTTSTSMKKAHLWVCGRGGFVTSKRRTSIPNATGKRDACGNSNNKILLRVIRTQTKKSRNHSRRRREEEQGE